MMSLSKSGGRHINPFICSTDDFREEREFLAANVFPALQTLCQQRAVCFQPYDWDHNLSKDRLKQGLALQLALRCINYASPYFIGLLGNQYGHHRPEDSCTLPSKSNDLPINCHWIERNIVIAAQHGYKWLLDESYASTSLTEFKIIQAAFLNNETKYCRFYIRDQVTSVQPQDQISRYEKFKLQQLKANIAKRGLYVSYYNSVEHLGELVTTNWTAIIDHLFPPFCTTSIGLELQVDAVHHRVFGEKRCEHLVLHPGVIDCFQKLTEFAANTNDYSYDPFIRAKQFEKSTGIRLLRKGRHQEKTETSGSQSICVITGSRGCGKTSLLSGWLRNEAAGVVPPGTAIVYHYATCNRMARNIAVFMKRCITELRQKFDSKYEDTLSMESEYTEFSQIKETFLATLALGPCLIVFDGLDEMSATMGHSMIEMKQMEWLASPLPPTCKFIFSATDSDLSVKSLHKRNDVLFCACLPIDSPESKLEILNEYISCTPNAENVELSAASVSQIVQYKQSSSPLYLNVIANELSDLNVSCDISAHLDVYANLDSISNSTRDMWTSLIKRWVRDYSWKRYGDDVGPEAKYDRLEDTVIGGWVPDCLRLLACSRDGLTVSEILGTLSYGMGYLGDRAVTTYDWCMFYDAAKPALYKKPNGLIIINHEHLVEVIDFLLLGNISPPSLHETNADFQHLQKLGGMERRQYHISLASHLLSKGAQEQLIRIEEILWQLEVSGDFARLCNMLIIPLVMEKMYGSIYGTYNPLRIELIRFCKLLKEKKVEFGTKMVQQLAKLGFMESSQIQEIAEVEAGDLSMADGQSAAFSQLSQSQLGHTMHRPVARYRRPDEESAASSVAGGVSVPASNHSDALASASEHFSSLLRDTTTQASDGRQNLPSQNQSTVRTTSGQSSRADAAVRPSTAAISVSGSSLQDDQNMDMLISKAASGAEIMSLALTCAKLIITLEGGQIGYNILEQLATWAKQKYPLTNEELYILCHVYESLSSLSNDRQNYKLALDQLFKAHECLLDISNTIEDDGHKAYDDKLLSYIKAKLKIELSAVCITSGDLLLAQSYIDEARMGMEEIKCTSGVNYTLYNLALLSGAQQDYLRSTNYLLKCLDYFELKFGTLHPIVAEISHSLGKLLSDEDNHETSDHAVAEEYLWKALNIRRERQAESLATAESLFQLAFLVQKQGCKTRKKEAMELLQNCLDIHARKLGNEHEATKTVTYLLNDLEISVQLGQFEFGAAKPIDSRSANYPFSQLSMHEEDLLEYNESIARKQRPSTSSRSSRALRPQSAFNIEKPRCESRLHRALAKRPKTAPISLQRPFTPNVKRSAPDTGLGDEDGNVPDVYVAESELSSVASSPRTYRSYGQDLRNTSRIREYSPKQSVLKKYFPVDRHDPHYRVTRATETYSHSVPSSAVKPHKCHNIEAHTIHEKLRSTTLGPNSAITSVVGYTRPTKKVEPIHKAAWYHSPNHYATAQKPHVNQKVYAQRKQRLMQQRSQSSPIKSRYLQDHTNAIKLIAQYESAITSI